jgi:hypothetical protein
VSPDALRAGFFAAPIAGSKVAWKLSRRGKASHAILGDQNGTEIARKPHAVLRAIPLLLL